MAIVPWSEYLTATDGRKPIEKGGSAGVYYEDYNLDNAYWRYTWTHFTLEPHPEFVEVNRMDFAYE